MDRKIRLKITTPEGVFLDGEVRGIYFATKLGQKGILFGHENFSSSVKDGFFVVDDGINHKIDYSIFGGTLLFSKNQCLVITEFIAKADEADALREQRRIEYEALYKAQQKDEQEIKRARISMQKNLIRSRDSKDK